MDAPDLHVLLHDGSTMCLRDFFTERPLCIIFLRQLGSIFSRSLVAKVRKKPNWNVVFVTMAPPKLAAEFKCRRKSPHPFVSDMDRQLYMAFNVPRGNRRQIVNLRTATKGVQSAFKGVFKGRALGDVFQLGAVFIIVPTGEITWEHRYRDVSDNPRMDVIGRQLEIAGRKCG